MTTHDSTPLHHRTIFDDWRSLTIGIYMALIGYAVMVGIPVISTSWVNNLALGFGYPDVFILCASVSIMAMLVYLYMYLMLRHKIPALADAS